MKPLDPRLVSKARATAGYLILVVALAIFATAATLTIAWSIASFVVAIFVDSKPFEDQIHFLWLALIAGFIRALVHFFQEWFGHRVAGRVKLELRKKALTRLSKTGSAQISTKGTGELSQLLGGSLDSLDSYFSKYLPQLIFTALVTPALTALIWHLDGTSGITVLLTLPLIPLFMVMIGYVTRDYQDKQLDALERLNGHFFEIIRGITTLKIFGRIDKQERILVEVSKQYRSKTMRVLRLSFLSGFALELAASLSVALIAVSIGIRLVDGNLDLFTGLFILIIAPEVYLPLRNVGAQFHAAAEGVSVSTRVLDLLEEEPISPLFSLDIKPNGLTVITGPSGIGKSLALRKLAESGGVWMPQTSGLLPGTLTQNICLEDQVELASLYRAIEMAQLGSFSLDQELSELSLSGGERQRVGLARALYRSFVTQDHLLLLDEPTSQLDWQIQESVIDCLKGLVAEGYQIVAISHSKQLISAADSEVKVG